MAVYNPNFGKAEHTIDIKTRTDGIEHWYEGDWIKYVPELYKYLRHLDGCNAEFRCGDDDCCYIEECTCGLDETLRKIPGNPLI